MLPRLLIRKQRARCTFPTKRYLSAPSPPILQQKDPIKPPSSTASNVKKFLIAPLLSVTALFTIATGTTLAMAAYGTYRINKSRTRWFSDSFVLSPESLRMPYKKINLLTEDNVKLEGWYIEQTHRGKPSDRVVLCCNPFNHDKSTLLAVARGLWGELFESLLQESLKNTNLQETDTGHSVLLFDFRSFGPEKVPHETIGHLELNDARAAITWLRANKPPTAKIGLMGCSMGGAMSLCLAIENDEEIVGVATDCAFACLRDVVFNYVIRTLPENLPKREWYADLVVYAMGVFNQMFYGYDLAKVGPAGLGLHRLKIPLLVLHSEQDSIVPVDQGIRIFQESSTPPSEKQFILVQQCEHIGSFFADEILYTKRIVQFLDKCFAHIESNKR